MKTSIHSMISFFVVSLVLIAGCAGTQPADQSPSETPDMGEVGPNTAVLVVHGMGCPQCAYNVDVQLLKVPGVESVAVDMGTGRVLAHLSPASPPTREQLSQAIDETGFTLVSIEMPGE